MFSLILKDILIQKRMILFVSLYIVFMLLVFTGIDNEAVMFTISSVVVTYMLTLTACAIDDKNKSDIMLNSLPISRAKIVGARYLASFIFLIFGLVYYTVITALIRLLNLPIKVYPINVEGILGALFAITLINSIYLPIFFRFGYVK